MKNNLYVIITFLLILFLVKESKSQIVNNPIPYVQNETVNFLPKHCLVNSDAISMKIYFTDSNGISLINLTKMVSYQINKYSWIECSLDKGLLDVENTEGNSYGRLISGSFNLKIDKNHNFCSRRGYLKFPNGEVCIDQDGENKLNKCEVSISSGGLIINNQAISISLKKSQQGVRYYLMKDNQMQAHIAGTGGLLEFGKIKKEGNYYIYAEAMNTYLPNGDKVRMSIKNDIYISNLNIDNDKNFILTSTLTEHTDTKLNFDINYIDGFGRTIQTSSIKRSPSGADIINKKEYDQFGRQSIIYLPYTSNKNGSFDKNSLENQSSFYNCKTSKVTNSKTPFSKTIFDGSPLNQVVEQGSVGEAWQTKLNNSGNTIKIRRSSNISNEVRLYKVSLDGKLNNDNDFYDACELIVTQTFNENWKPGDGDLNSIKIYKDKSGRTVLSRSFLRDKNKIINLSTYNVYDVYGNLRYVLSPQSLADNKKPNQSTIENYCYYYEYDGSNRMISKKLPGVDVVYMIYDNLGRLVLMQDGNKRALNTWIYSIYDNINRVIETGTFISSKDVNILRKEININNNYVPTEDRSVLTKIIYDNYVDDKTFMKDASCSCVFKKSIKVKGLITSTKVRVLDDRKDSWIETNNYYDDDYRLIQTVKNLYPSGFMCKSFKYDFIGNLLQSRIYQEYGGNKKLIDTYFTYNKLGCITSINQAIDNNDKQTLAIMSYNELGQLIDKKLHAKDELAINYSYNIRGWLKSINKDKGHNFNMNIYYHDIDSKIINHTKGKNQFNGNIAAISWSNSTDIDKKQIYTFKYDDVSRLSSAEYSTLSNGVYKSRKLEKIEKLEEVLVSDKQLLSSLEGTVFLYKDAKLVEKEKENLLIHKESIINLEKKILESDKRLEVVERKVSDFSKYDKDRLENRVSKDKKTLNDLESKVLKSRNRIDNYANKSKIIELLSVKNSIKKYETYLVATCDKLEAHLKSNLKPLFFEGRKAVLLKEIQNYSTSLASCRGKASDLEDIIGDESSVERYAEENKNLLKYNNDIKELKNNILDSENQLKVYIDLLPLVKEKDELKYNLSVDRANLRRLKNKELRSQNIIDVYEKSISDIASLEDLNESIKNLKIKINNAKKDLEVIKEGHNVFGDFSVTGISYDYNGNIMSLKRNAFDHKDKSVKSIDDLNYVYTGNQLKSVEDLSNSIGFINGITAKEEYFYDENGNMIKDLNKGITNIEYNILNLPKDINFTNGRNVKYIYSGTGEKLQNIIGSDTTSYCGVLIYRNSHLEYILNTQGRSVIHDNDICYEYFIKDHLGNVRAVLDGNTEEVKQESNYYPFGGTFNSFDKSSNRYFYNSKELQKETKWLDYGARMYSTDLARWMCVDPLSEKYTSLSTYNYCSNNPVNFIDPDGRAKVNSTEEWKKINGITDDMLSKKYYLKKKRPNIGRPIATDLKGYAFTNGNWYNFSLINVSRASSRSKAQAKAKAKAKANAKLGSNLGWLSSVIGASEWHLGNAMYNVRSFRPIVDNVGNVIYKATSRYRYGFIPGKTATVLGRGLKCLGPIAGGIGLYYSYTAAYEEGFNSRNVLGLVFSGIGFIGAPGMCVSALYGLTDLGNERYGGNVGFISYQNNMFTGKNGVSVGVHNHFKSKKS